MSKTIKKYIKPLSYKVSWSKNGHKTKEFKAYEYQLNTILPKRYKLPKPPYKLSITFATKTKQTNIQDPLLPLIDILQRKYLFKMQDLEKIELLKETTDSDKEYIKIKFSTLKKE